MANPLRRRKAWTGQKPYYGIKVADEATNPIAHGALGVLSGGRWISIHRHQSVKGRRAIFENREHLEGILSVLGV